MQPSRVRAVVAEHWGIPVDEVAALGGGMNSETWKVTGGGRRWVLKVVGRQGPPGFLAGLRAAIALEESGISTGAPSRTRNNSLVAELDEGAGALLTWVDGTPLTAAAHDAARIGTALGDAHQILRHTKIADAPPFDWVDGDAPHLGVEPWVRPAVAGAVHAWDRIRPVVTTWSFLHGDPAPEVFLQNSSTHECGIIDWASGVLGPCVYDLASACMYLGGDAVAEVAELVEAYAATGPVPRREIELGLPSLLRYRYAVQADYFARRLDRQDLTGLGDPQENQRGLDDARRMWGGWA